MKILASFSVNPFYGEIARINSIRDLHRVVHARCGLLGGLDDEQGFPRDPESFTEEELLAEFRSVSRHDIIELVDSVDALKALSNDPKYLELSDLFIETNKLAR
ncbi:TPA: hypothetical protein ACMDOZ_002131 [Vibrio cholerae]